MIKTGRGVVFFGLLALIITITASAIAWWRWERVLVIAENIPLPPGTEIIKEPDQDSEKSGPINYTCRTVHSGKKILAFFDQHLTNKGWEKTRVSDNRFRYRSRDKVVRLVLHPQVKITVFTIEVDNRYRR